VRVECSVKDKVVNTVKIVNKGLDGLITKKGVLKMILVSSPVLFSYYYFFNRLPFQDGIKNQVALVVREVHRNHELYNIHKEVGKAQAYWELALNEPATMNKLIGSNLLGKIYSFGLPFIAGLIIKSRIESGHYFK